jgi:hypothetical protein
VAKTRHKSRSATTSRNVEVKRVQRVRFLGLLPAPLCANVSRELSLYMNFFQLPCFRRRPATRRSRLRESAPTAAAGVAVKR